MADVVVRVVPVQDTRALRQAVLRPDDSLELLASHEPPGAIAFGAFEDGALVGVGLVGADGDPGAWRVRGMAVAPHARGRGAGTTLLAALLEAAQRHGATSVWCNARVPAIGLYERAGFTATSGVFDLPPIGPHVRMARATAGDPLRTDRLVLRPWRPEDRGPFAALNADPEVMAEFPAPMTRAESDALADTIDAHFAEHGWGLWAVEADGRFAGFTGLAVPSFEAHFTPAVEIGWRLPRWAWGHGYATEAARTGLAFAFDRLAVDEVVSFTATTNERSQAVMRRLGMTRDPADDFDHPKIAEGDRLRRHVLYRIGRERGSW